MSETTVLALYVAGAYLAGAIPFGFLAGRLKGVDLRKVGSENIGASNAGRVLGRHWFFIVLILDALKGFLPVLLAGQWLADSTVFAGEDQLLRLQVAWLGVALAAILGHLFPIYLGFRGGRGVATSLGVVLAIWPYYTIPGLLAFATWGVVKKVSGYISVASIVACCAFPIWVVVTAVVAGWPVADLVPLIAFGVLVGLLVIIRHWPNIQRLRAGAELSPDRAERTGESETSLQDS